MEYAKTKSAEDALVSMMMYLYQAYTEEQNIPSDVAKQKVVDKVLENLQKFEGDEKPRHSVNPSTNTRNNAFMISTIEKSLSSLEEMLKSSTQHNYLLETVKFNVNKLINDNKLV